MDIKQKCMIDIICFIIINCEYKTDANKKKLDNVSCQSVQLLEIYVNWK